jgi:hypothetical protein
MLSNVRKSHSWNLKQTSSFRPGTQSYNVSYKSKSVTVLISSLISTLVEADVKFEHDDIEYDEDQKASQHSHIGTSGSGRRTNIDDYRVNRPRELWLSPLRTKQKLF